MDGYWGKIRFPPVVLVRASGPRVRLCPKVGFPSDSRFTPQTIIRLFFCFFSRTLFSAYFRVVLPFPKVSRERPVRPDSQVMNPECRSLPSRSPIEPMGDWTPRGEHMSLRFPPLRSDRIANVGRSSLGEKILRVFGKEISVTFFKFVQNSPTG